MFQDLLNRQRFIGRYIWKGGFCLVEDHVVMSRSGLNGLERSRQAENLIRFCLTCERRGLDHGLLFIVFLLVYAV